MLKDIEINKLKLINDLVRVASANKINQIEKYNLNCIKKDNAIYVEAIQTDKTYSVFLKAKCENIKTDCVIPIVDSLKFDQILSTILKKETTDVYIEDNLIKLLSNDDISMPMPNDDLYDDSIDDLKKLFTSNNYGDSRTKIKKEVYEQIDKENPKPDAKVKFFPERIEIKKVKKIFEGEIKIKIEKDIMLIEFGVGRSFNIVRPIEKENDKDLTTIQGRFEATLQNIDCISLLATKKGFVQMELKKDFPMFLSKVFNKEQIGVCYLVSLKEDEK